MVSDTIYFVAGDNSFLPENSEEAGIVSCWLAIHVRNSEIGCAYAAQLDPGNLETFESLFSNLPSGNSYDPEALVWQNKIIIISMDDLSEVEGAVAMSPIQFWHCLLSYSKHRKSKSGSQVAFYFEYIDSGKDLVSKVFQ